jgi:regulator of replication initiation timing
MVGQTIRYSWPELNTKLTDCFDAVRGDARELFSKIVNTTDENSVLRIENEILRAQIEILKSQEKGA